MPEQVEIQTDPYCREHGVSRYQYQEGHVGNASRLEARPRRRRTGWEELLMDTYTIRASDFVGAA